MVKKVLVSVIITTKDSARTLNGCLESLKNQTYKNFELIIVDNNSTDETFKIAKKYTNFIFNIGPERSSQRNFGAKKARGKYLLIHDSDIYFHKDSIKECVLLFEKFNCEAVILPEKSIGIGFWAKVKAFEREFYTNKDLIEAPRFFQKKVYFQFGGYDETITGFEDWDFYNKLKMVGGKALRANNYVLHDEGKLKIFGNARKKNYYLNWLPIYSERYPLLIKKQLNFFYRFPINKLLKKGLKNPFLLIFMIIMKYFEVMYCWKKLVSFYFKNNFLKKSSGFKCLFLFFNLVKRKREKI